MKAHIFQHVPFEGPGSIGTWLKKQKANISTTRFYQDEFPPDIDAVDLLVIMGGPMSVNDSDTHPWLEIEKAYINAVIQAGKPVLGICLGAQLIASAMGAKVCPGKTKEIGWFPVASTLRVGKSTEAPTAGTDPFPLFRLPEELTVFHWHGETFDLPADAVLLASSPACPHQAFQLKGKKVVGLQFHLETTTESLDAIIENCRDELQAAPFVMKEEEMREASPTFLDVNQAHMDQLLDFLIR